MTAKADRAKEILDDPVLQEAFENLRMYYLSKFEELPLAEENVDPKVYIELKMLLAALGQVKANLRKMVQVGNLEDFRAQQNEEMTDVYRGKH